MSNAAADPAEIQAPRRPASRAHRALEILLVGGATVGLFPIAWLLRHALGREAAIDFVDFWGYHASFVINNPHFAITYLLFYKDVHRLFRREVALAQRVRYFVAGILVPVALIAWAAAALRSGSAEVMGILIQLMFFLVGWHYAKQGFGILVVLSARRGFFFRPWERRALLAHSFAAWAHAWATPFDPGKEVREKGVVYTTIAHPTWLIPITWTLFVASGVAAIGFVASRAWRERSAPPLGPLLAYAITLWLWTVYTTLDPLMVYAIPALHSIQYLYFVWLRKRGEARAFEGPPHFGRPALARFAIAMGASVALAWVLFHGAPEVFDAALSRSLRPGAPRPLGPTPYLAAFYVFVNIHHYFMDHVIWRRESPETKYLLS